MRTSRESGRLALAAVLIAACTSAVAATAAGAFEFPAMLGGFLRGEQIDFESREPGLGIGVHYFGPGVKATVYVYGFRIADLPEGIESDVVRVHAQQAAEDIRAVNGEVEVLSAQAPGSGHCTSFLQAKYSFADRGSPSGGAAHSYLYLGSRKGNFVKVRITYPAQGDLAAKEAAQERFAQALCKFVAD